MDLLTQIWDFNREAQQKDHNKPLLQKVSGLIITILKQQLE